MWSSSDGRTRLRASNGALRGARESAASTSSVQAAWSASPPLGARLLRALASNGVTGPPARLAPLGSSALAGRRTAIPRPRSACRVAENQQVTEERGRCPLGPPPEDRRPEDRCPRIGARGLVRASRIGARLEDRCQRFREGILEVDLAGAWRYPGLRRTERIAGRAGSAGTNRRQSRGGDRCQRFREGILEVDLAEAWRYPGLRRTGRIAGRAGGPARHLRRRAVTRRQERGPDRDVGGPGCPSWTSLTLTAQSAARVVASSRIRSRLPRIDAAEMHRTGTGP